MKIAVYAICKNEEKHIDTWYNSMKEADSIYVCDTGSDDNSIAKLKEYNINVKSINVNPWRFDTARNISLDFVPDDYDICVCTDLDEIFQKGWRKELEEKWQDNTTRASYNYIWSFKENNAPDKSFYINKIHTRKNYKWIHPVHEVLEYTGKNEKIIILEKVCLEHHQDFTKSRGKYLELLELSIKENPNDDRNMHYLGREYMYYKKYDKAIKTLKAHLNLPTATWKDERCASMRYIAKCYEELQDNFNAFKWYIRAIAQAPYLREPYIETGIFAYKNNNWELCIFSINEALKIKNKPISYINEGYCWDSTPYDILSIAYYNIGLYKKSLDLINKAIELSPNDLRLKENFKTVKEFVN